MTPADKAKAQMRSMGLSAPYIGSKETRTEEEIKQDQKTLAENVPILGEAMLAKEIGEDIKDKNYLSAGLNTLALGVGVVPGVGKVASKPIRSAARAVRKGYNPKDPASRVFHLTKKDFDAADVVGKGTSDIGFHVGTAAQASGRGSTGLGYDRELMEKMVEGERILPLVLKYNLKPARIPDMSSFKSPQNWIGNLSVAKSDRSRIKFLLGEQADADLLAKAPRVTVGGDTYYMLPDVMREGMDPELWKDLILEASRAKRIGLDTISKQEDRITWFSTLKHTANKHGYDSFVYKNEYEGVSRDTVPTWQEELNTPSLSNDSYMLLEADQAKGLFGKMTEGSPEFMKNKGGLMLQKGGAIPMNNMSQQMELFEPAKTGFDSGGLTKSTSSDQLLIDFNAIADDYNESRNISGSQRAITGEEMMSIFDALTGNKIKLTPVNMQEGGLLDEGGTKDPVSGNDVPPGSMQEEVRDDIPAQLSEGEFVFPADVVRFIGLEKLMKIRQRAKAGLQRMDDMGQMGNSEEAIMPDDLPFSIDDLDMEDDGLEMAQGGVVSMANGGNVTPMPGGGPAGPIGSFPLTNTFPGALGTNPNPNPLGLPTVPSTGTAPAPMQAASSGGVDPNLGGTKFTGTAIQPITMPFQEAKGPGVINVEEKNVVYVNEAGQERTFIVKADGTVIDPATGQEVNPETLGFKVKTDTPKTQTTTGTGVQTATVTDDGDGGGDEGPPTGATVSFGGTPAKGNRAGLVDGAFRGSLSFTGVGLGDVRGFLGSGVSSLTEAVSGGKMGNPLSLSGNQGAIISNIIDPSTKRGVGLPDTLSFNLALNADQYNKYITRSGPTKVTDRQELAGIVRELSKIDDVLKGETLSMERAGYLAESIKMGREDDIRDSIEKSKGFEKSLTAALGRDRGTVKGSGIFGTDIFGAERTGAISAAERAEMTASEKAAADKAVADYVSSMMGGQPADDDEENEPSGGDNQGDTGTGGGTGASGGDPGPGEMGVICLTENMKVKRNGVIDFVTKVQVGDIVDNTVVTEVLHKHMREGYYVVNGELKITNDHPVLANGSWKLTEDLVLGDYINDVKVASIEYIEKVTPTVYIGTEADRYTVYTEGATYTVHGQYKNALKKAA